MSVVYMQNYTPPIWFALSWPTIAAIGEIFIVVRIEGLKYMTNFCKEQVIKSL